MRRCFITSSVIIFVLLPETLAKMHCSIKKCFYNKYHPKYSKSNPETTYHYFPHPEKEIDRYNSWLRAIDIPELLTKDRMIVFRQSRICRRHFDKDCFNGGVKRLIKTAVPSLYLSSSNQVQEDNRIISNDITLGKRKHSKTDMDDENAEVIDAEDDGKVTDNFSIHITDSIIVI